MPKIISASGHHLSSDAGGRRQKLHSINDVNNTHTRTHTHTRSHRCSQMGHGVGGPPRARWQLTSKFAQFLKQSSAVTHIFQQICTGICHFQTKKIQKFSGEGLDPTPDSTRFSTLNPKMIIYAYLWVHTAAKSQLQLCTQLCLSAQQLDSRHAGRSK